MRKIIIIGGSKGIGKAITESLLSITRLLILVEPLQSLNTKTYRIIAAIY